MTKCFFCKKNIGLLVFRCRLCLQPYCTHHRIPEDHLCNNILKFKDEVVNTPDAVIDNHNYTKL